MLHDVIIGKEKLAEVSKRYCRSQGYISSLVGRLRKNNNLLGEMISTRDEKLMKQNVIQKVIKDLMEEECFISTAQVVIDEVKVRLDIVVTKA